MIRLRAVGYEPRPPFVPHRTISPAAFTPGQGWPQPRHCHRRCRNSVRGFTGGLETALEPTIRPDPSGHRPDLAACTLILSFVGIPAIYNETPSAPNDQLLRLIPSKSHDNRWCTATRSIWKRPAANQRNGGTQPVLGHEKLIASARVPPS